MKPKRILFIITELASGGAEMMLFRLLSNLDRNAFEPYVLGLGVEGPVGDRILNLGIPVGTLNLRGVWSNPFNAARLLGMIRRIKPDLVHTWMYHSNLLGGVLAKVAGIRAVIWGIHHTNLDPALNKRSTLWVSRLCGLMSSRVPSMIISCSKVAQMAHVNAGYCDSKFLIIPNGIDTSMFRPDAAARATIRNQLGIPNSAKVIGMIARWDRQKDHAMFFRAAARVLHAAPPAYFVLAGNGIEWENQEVIRLIEAGAQTVPGVDLQHFTARTRLLGPRPDIEAVMASLDVLASSSLGEAFSNVIAEAMSAGVPAVVTEVGDSALIVGDTGRVVPPGDDQAFADALMDILASSNDDYHRLSACSRERIVDNFDIRTIVRAHETVYHDVLRQWCA